MQVKQQRQWKGYDPNVTMDVLCDMNRREWRLGERARHQDAAMFVYDGVVVAMMTIDGVEKTQSGRWSIVGRIIQRGEPLYDQYVEKKTPKENKSQNPVSYYTPQGDLVERLRPLVEDMGGTRAMIEWLETASKKGLLPD